MNPQKTKIVISLTIIFIPILIGALIISPLLNIDKNIGLFLGGILSIILLKVAYPESFNETQEQAKTERMLIKQRAFLDLYFFHPTKLPLTLSMIIFVLKIACILILDKLNIEIIEEVFQIGLLGCMFLWGLSGFLVITRNQFFDELGRKYTGFWTYLQGSVLIFLGWGGIVLYTLGSIFNW